MEFNQLNVLMARRPTVEEMMKLSIEEPCPAQLRKVLLERCGGWTFEEGQLGTIFCTISAPTQTQLNQVILYNSCESIWRNKSNADTIIPDVPFVANGTRPREPTDLTVVEFRVGPYLPIVRLLDGVSVFFISSKSPSAEIIFW